ncbi:MAG: flagellar biosynthetic protein FliO [Desulfotalea sp.]
MITKYLLLTIFLLTPSLALAADNDYLSGYFRMLWSLAIVVGVMFIIFAIVKKRFSPFSTSSKKKIKVLEIQAIMPKKSLCLVEVNNKTFLLAISQDNIQKIAEFPKDECNNFDTALANASKTKEHEVGQETQ